MNFSFFSFFLLYLPQCSRPIINSILKYSFNILLPLENSSFQTKSVVMSFILFFQNEVNLKLPIRKRKECVPRIYCESTQLCFNFKQIRRYKILYLPLWTFMWTAPRILNHFHTSGGIGATVHNSTVGREVKCVKFNIRLYFFEFIWYFIDFVPIFVWKTMLALIFAND